ncbi:MAG: GNAT family N-acetyltransferase [Oscillochloridaceae bacterium]|nr:GNAT family N-acetyltransferase [Chloroflexaceae bacterium]MDW8390852.1 GNAT family N-acetyltransferase [Oscillochloridaceae bacterium]
MITCRQRDYQGAEELDAVLDLWCAARAVDQGDPWPPLDALHAELAARQAGACDTRVWEDAHGQPVGAALLLDACILIACARPGAETEALATEMLAWGLQSVARITHGRGEHPCLFVPARSDDRRFIALLERAGFEADPWRTLRMRRSLRDPIAEPQVPPGIVIRPVAGMRDIAAIVALHDVVFAGCDKDLDDRAALMRAPGYQPALDLVAVGPTGALAGYVLGVVALLERERLGQASGWIEFVGVERSQRRLGVGRALVLRLLHAMRGAGLDAALLSTGAANLAACRLFAACGFAVWHEIRWYVREAGPDEGRPARVEQPSGLLEKCAP